MKVLARESRCLFLYLYSSKHTIFDQKMNNYTKMAVFCINIHFLEQMTTKSSKIVKKLRNRVISNQISKDKIYA